ncbi:MAG TPA: Kiwa anti-phage protein KwaB-like domain-containing protein [Candidatus Saccharimonadales bacterium]|nr:Kiwa anti-phage protein KwaB-like domain-containing protein [Candidatus Saccharimonadales bacterium]
MDDDMVAQTTDADGSAAEQTGELEQEVRTVEQQAQGIDVTNKEKAEAEQKNNKANDIAEEDVVNLEHTVPGQEQIAHISATEMAAQIKEVGDGEYHPVDVFAWANNLYQYKNQLKTELFLINKNSVVYRTKLDKEIEKQLQPLFIDEILNYILTGIDTGLTVRAFEDGDAQENVLQRTRWENVERLAEVMHWVNTQESEMEVFVEEEHDLKRIKGALLRCTHPAFKQPFYVIKALPAAQMLKGDGVWMVKASNFGPFADAAALRIPADNQMLLIEEDLFVFNQAKLDRLFGYNAKKNSVAAKKVAEIEEHFKLSFADGMDMQSLIKGNKTAINKLQKVQIGDLTQNAIVDHADELGVGLMQDEAGAIIIENTKDLNKFVNLLNDDYMESQLTGIRYEIRGKKPLPPPKDDAAAEIAL